MARFLLSQSEEWELVNPEQDVRGREVRDADGDKVGVVRDLVVNSDSERVEAVVIGYEVPAAYIEIAEEHVRIPSTRTPRAGTFTCAVRRRVASGQRALPRRA